MQMSWLDAWTSYSVTTRQIKNKVSIYSGLVYAAGKAFGLDREVALIPDAKVLKLRDSASLQPAREQAAQVTEAIDSLAGAALQALRQCVKSNIDRVMASRPRDQVHRQTLRELASSSGLTEARALGELASGPTVAAADVVRRVKRHQASLRGEALITPHVKALLQLMDAGLAINTALSKLGLTIEPEGVKSARNNAGAATLHRLQCFAEDLASGLQQLHRLEALGLDQERQNIADLTGRLLAEMTRITGDKSRFSAVRGEGLATAESQLKSAFEGSGDEPPLLARVVRDAQLHADPVRYGLGFDELLRVAFVLYARYTEHRFTKESAAVTQHVHLFAPIVQDAHDYCVRAGIEAPAARLLVSRIWLMAQLHRSLSTQPDEAGQQHCWRIFVAYLDLFFQRHNHGGKWRSFIEAPLIYWTQGLDFTAGFNEESEQDKQELLEVLEQELEQTKAWPKAPENLPLLKELIARAGALFAWDLLLKPVAERYDERVLTQKTGRACHNEHSVHNQWTHTRNPQPYALNPIYALIRPDRDLVPHPKKKAQACQ